MANDPAATKRARAKKGEKKSNVSNLIAGLEFVLVAQREQGEPRQTHCVMQNIEGRNWILASDGGLSAGCPIDDELNAVPHTRSLLKALKRAGDGQVTVVQLPSGKLSIRGGKFNAQVPCLPPDHVGITPPDPNIAQLTNDIKLAFAATYPLTNESAPEPRNAGVLLQSMTAVGTNGYCLLEYWHGIDLPPGLLIPKASAKAVAECKKNLVGFGFTDRSVTFHFEDGSFLKTALFEPKYPDYARILNVQTNPWPIPPDFFTALDVVAEFSGNHLVFFDTNLMKSSKVEGEGATYEVAGLPGGMGFNEKYLNLCREHMLRVDFKGDAIFFFTDNSRGIVKGVDMGKRAEAPAPVPPPPMPGQDLPYMADPDMQDDYANP